MTMKQAILAFLLGLTLMPGLRGTGWAAGSETWGAIFQSQLERCWEKPHDLHLGGLAVDELEATFTIKFKRDGTLEGPPIWAESATPYVAAYQMRVRDAVIKCQPYNLPAAYFNEWKHFELTFSERNPNSTRLPSNTPMQSLVDWIGTSMMSIPDVKEAFSDCQKTLLHAENDTLAKVDAAIQKETSRTTQQQLITIRDHAASVKEAHARAGCLKRLLIPIMLDEPAQAPAPPLICCARIDQIVLMDGDFLIERLHSRLADLTDVGFGQYLAKLSMSNQEPELVLIGNGDTKNCFMTKLFATPNMFGNYGSVTGGMSCHGKLEDALVEIAKEIP